MKKKLLFCLSFIFIVCTLCLPLALGGTKATAANGFDPANYTIINAAKNEYTNAKLYSNGVGEFLVGSQGAGSAKSKKLSVQDIETAPSGGHFVRLPDFDGEVFFMPDGGEKASVELTDPNEIKITARKAGKAIVLVAIGSSTTDFEIYAINFDIVCDLKSVTDINFYKNDDLQLNVGEQRSITFDNILNYIRNNGSGTYLVDYSDLVFDRYTIEDEAPAGLDGGLEVKIAENKKMFTIHAKKEAPDSYNNGVYRLTVSLKDKTPDSKPLMFTMRVRVTTNLAKPLITVDAANISVNKTERFEVGTFAISPDGNDVFFNANADGTRHALRDNKDRQEETELGTKILLVKNEICEIRIVRLDPTDERKNVLEIYPIKNGTVSISVYVANFVNDIHETKLLLTVTVKQMYAVETIYIDSLKKATLSIHDTEIFGKLEEDGYSLTSIDSSTASTEHLVAKVESGSLILNPKAAGTVELILVFSDGGSKLSIPVTVEIHKFDFWKDFSQLAIIGIFAAILLFILLVILLIVRGAKRRKKRVVEKVESTVVIGKRDASGQVINTTLLRAQNQKPVFATSNTMVSPMPFIPQMLPPQPHAQTNIALNAGFAPQAQAQPTQVFLNQPPMQQPTQNIFMALPQREQSQTQYQPQFQTQYQPQMQPQTEVQNQYALGAAPTQAPVINFFEAERQEQPAPQTIVLAAQEQGQQTLEATIAEQVQQESTEYPEVTVNATYVYSSLNPSDDEILEKVFRERYQSTMKYRAFKKDRELQSQILEEERARLQKEIERLEEAKNAAANAAKAAAQAENKLVDITEQKEETAVTDTAEGSTAELVSSKWIEEATLSELIDKKIDLEEELLKTNSAIKEIDAEKERMEVAANDAMKQYKKLEGEIEDLKIELNEIKNPDDAAPIYEKLNAKEGEYNELKEDMPTFVAKLKERREELDKLDESNKKYKANLELSKMDLDDRIKELKTQPTDGAKEETSIVEEEQVWQEEVEIADDGQKDELSSLVESILMATAERGETELKREDLKLKKEFAEEELKEVSEKMAKSNNDAERQMLKSDIAKLNSDISEYKKILAGFDALMAEQAVAVQEKEAKLAAFEKYDEAAIKLKELAAQKAKLEAELKEEKERIIADRQTAEDKKQKSEEMDALTEFMLKTMNDRNRTELKADNIKFRKELADQKIKDLEVRLASSETPSEQANLKNEIKEKKEDILEYSKKLREYESYIGEYDDRLKELEESLASITNKYGMEKQLQEFSMARVQQDFDHKVDKERIRSERTIETERIEAERKLERERQEAEKMLERERQQGEARFSTMADERLRAAERAFEQARLENERKLKELEEKAKQGSLEERLAFKRQQLNFVSEDIPRMKDSEQGDNILQKVEKIEKDLAQDERNSDIIFEIGRVKDSVNHSIQLCKLREELSKRDTASVVKQAPAPQAAPPMAAQQAPQQQTRTVVRKVTNNVRKVASNKSRQPQVIRVQGSRPRPEGRTDRPARRPEGSSSIRMGGARPERPVSRSARPATSGGTRGAASRPTRPAGARPQARPSRPAPRR